MGIWFVLVTAQQSWASPARGRPGGRGWLRGGRRGLRGWRAALMAAWTLWVARSRAVQCAGGCFAWAASAVNAVVGFRALRVRGMVADVLPRADTMAASGRGAGRLDAAEAGRGRAGRGASLRVPAISKRDGRASCGF